MGVFEKLLCKVNKIGSYIKIDKKKIALANVNALINFYSVRKSSWTCGTIQMSRN